MTVKQLENGSWYLDPEWKDIICREIEKDLDNVEENYLTDWWDIENCLELEVQKRNLHDDKKKAVIDWMYELITAQVEPAVLNEETEFIKNRVEYMKVSSELKDE